MDLSFTEEQLALRDAAQRLLCRADMSTRVGEELDAPLRRWQQFAELGWTALVVPEQHGGLAGSDVDLAILMESFGHHRINSPYLASAVLCATVLERVAPSVVRDDLLVAIATGEATLSLAYLETDTRAPVHASAAQESPGLVRLSGSKVLVLSAPHATHFIVSARRERLMELYLVPTDAEGLTHVEYTTLSGERAWDIDFRDVTLPIECRLDAGATEAALEFALDRAAVAIAFDALGSAEAMLSATAAYVSTRQQFGRPLTALQVVRHRLADMAVACEEARAIDLKAALSMRDANARPAAASAAKWKGVSCARFVAENAIQLHGAMGMTEELPIGAHFRRVLAAELLFDLPAHHLDRYARRTLPTICS